MKNPELRKKLAELLDSLKAKPGHVGDSDFIVVARVADFDPATNTEWELDGNKSHPRDLYCHFCKAQVVMSNRAWQEYYKAKNKPKIMCGKCMVEGIKNHETR